MELKREIKKSKINPKRISEIYMDCFFKEEELTNGIPNTNFSIAEGIRVTSVFNTDKINKYKQEIVYFINLLPRIEEGISYLSMSFDNEGIQWTNYHQDIEQLLQLGIACEVLSFPLEKSMWRLLPGKLPYVIKNPSKTETLVLGRNPEDLYYILRQNKRAK